MRPWLDRRSGPLLQYLHAERRYVPYSTAIPSERASRPAVSIQLKQFEVSGVVNDRDWHATREQTTQESPKTVGHSVRDREHPIAISS